MSATVLLSPRRSDTYVGESDLSAEEAADVLPSLPSSSSSLFIANTLRQTPHASPARRRRVTSLYGNPSIAASDSISIEGSSTYEYDVTSNIRKQQSRRRRGDSNASISTVVSTMSHAPSVAESLSPSVLAYEQEGYVRGQFTTASNSGAVPGDGTDGFPFRSIHGGGGRGDESPNDGGAAASLRRIRKQSQTTGAHRHGEGSSGAGKEARYTAAAPHDGGVAAHLTDKLEQLIANSVSYRAAHARGYTGGGGGGGGGAQHTDEFTSFEPRQRKSSYASLRSLIAFTSSNTPQTRQQSNGDHYAPSSSVRAASLFGVYMGRGGASTSQRSNLSATLRAPSWSQPVAAASASTLTSAGNGTFSNRAAGSVAQTDAIGSLRGLRSLFPPTAEESSSRHAHDVRPKIVTRGGTSRVINSIDTVTSPTASEQSGDKARSPTSPRFNGSGGAEGQDRQRHVSFHESLRKRATQGGVPSTSNAQLYSSTSSASASASASTRRAFASIDPTSSSNLASAANSGAATPRTVRSISPPLLNSRTSSRQDLTKDLSSAVAVAVDDAELSSVRSLEGSGHSHNAGGAMPALDAALARAEDRSGLKTSSRCTTCGKRVVNAPVSKSGDVFCSRDCRIEAKRKRQAEAKLSSAAAAATSTNAETTVPPTARLHDVSRAQLRNPPTNALAATVSQGTMLQSSAATKV